MVQELTKSEKDIILTKWATKATRVFSRDKDWADSVAITVGFQARRLQFSEKDLISWLQSNYGKVWVIGGSLNPTRDLSQVRDCLLKAYRTNIVRATDG